ncbi:MAG: hypothetical protein WC965_01865 [Thiohalomonadaceae bacterium]
MSSKRSDSVLYNFTRSLASGISSARVTVKETLGNLYITNATTQKSNLRLLYEGDFPIIYPQAYGQYLDRLGSMFDVSRYPGEGDEGYRIRILFAIRQNVTKDGISEALRLLFKSAMMDVVVDIRESYKEVFDGTSSTLDAPLRSNKGSLLYGITIVVRPVTAKLYVVRSYTGETLSLPVTSPFLRVRNNNYRVILDAFQVASFKALLNNTIASGVKVNKVIVVEPSAGGSKYTNI